MATHNPSEAPMFDPVAYQLTDKQIKLTALARKLGQEKFAERAFRYDREATFPTENYHDLYEADLMGICISEEYGGLGADFKTYALVAAEIGRYCGATALSWNMHVTTALLTGPITDQLAMPQDVRQSHHKQRALHYRRILDEGAIYAQPFSEVGSAAAGVVAFGTQAEPVEGGWKVNGRKIFASLAGNANYYGILCTEVAEGEEPSRRNTLYLAIPANAPGVSVFGDWDPLGMRGTVSRNLSFEDVFVPEEALLMPREIYYQAATRYPHMFATLAHTYMGLAQAAYDFTVGYLRGELPGMRPVKRRMYPTKQIAVAHMRITLEQTKALWYQMISEACVDPSKDQVLRAWSSQYTVMENANEIAQLAIRTCGGQSMLKSMSLERVYRDSRAGSLMLPWTAEICLDRLGKGCLYEEGESDD